MMSTVQRVDTEDMWGATLGLPEQVAAAAESAHRLHGLPDKEEVEHVVVLGMGGSGIAGDVLLATAAPVMPVPVVVCKSYELPPFVGEATLVFAISCSGNTEETLEAVQEAAMQGARIVAVTQGGELGRLCSGWGVPVITVPPSIPQPRAAIGALAIPPLVVLEDVGLYAGARRWIDLAYEQLVRRRDRLSEPGNEAEELARRIGRTFALVHGGGAVGAAAAVRFKCEINENANAPAFWGVQPEVCHNEVQGWGQSGDVTRQLVTLVQLRHDAEHPQVSRRFDLYAEIAREVFADVCVVRAEGEGELAQLFDLILFGDVVSLALAAQEGLDPGPVPTLNQIKAALSS